MYPNTYTNLPSTTALLFSTAAPVLATAMLFWSIARDYIPLHALLHYFFSKLRLTFTNEITLRIHEFDGLNKNQLFYAAEIFLGTLINPSTKSFRASLPEKENKIDVSIEFNEEIKDKFRDFQLKWRMVIKTTTSSSSPNTADGFFNSTRSSEVRHFELTFHQKNKNKVFDEYLPYVLERSKAVKEEKKTLKLHTLGSDGVIIMNGGRMGPWQSVNLDHPANFETLAMDGEMKDMIINDLDMFLKRKGYYRKVGKAWKRGYLLYGPPGTGKSSLIAAIANYLNFDVYDLELTALRSNSDLRKLLITTANRSILVVEDIDAASIDLSERSAAAAMAPLSNYQFNQMPKVTLSGLLNFIDGLWSSVGDERIIIFTTNHMEKLDPALLRPGRMDVQIHMSYCTPYGFKMLLTNYLGSTDHPLVLEAEALVASTKITPAEVGEYLLKSDDPGLALQGLIKFIEHKKESERYRNEDVKEPKTNLESVQVP